MHILHVCPSRSFSGLEQYALEMALDQRRKGHRVGFVVYPESSLHKEALKGEIEAIPFSYDKWSGLFSYWKNLFRILVQEKNLDVIHLHMTDEVARLWVPLFLS